MSVLTLEAKLERTDGSTPWGFRLAGGKDFSSPLTIQRVDGGSLAAKCGLQVGDIILKIGNTVTESLKHKDAKECIIGSGNMIDLLLQRGGNYTSASLPANNWINHTPAPVAPMAPVAAPAAPPAAPSSQNFNSAPRPFGGGAPTPQMQNLSLNSGGTPPPVAPAPYKPAPAPAPAPVAVPAAKPWTPAPAPAPAPAVAPAPPVVNASPRPFGNPPKPTGQGATRGKKGDAAMNPAALPTTGRIPVCAYCNMPIRGPFVTALGKCWCPHHFVCATEGCCKNLLDIGFVEEAGYLYCENCYGQQFAPCCDKCGKPIIGECVNAMNKSFHPECFLCAQCGLPIGGTKFHIEDGKFYCERDWAAMFQTMCASCDFPIEPGDRWVEAMSKNFHSECFNCSACQVNLEGQQFAAKGGKPYCKKHAR